MSVREREMTQTGHGRGGESERQDRDRRREREATNTQTDRWTSFYVYRLPRNKSDDVISKDASFLQDC